jgi:DNA-binding transcriptional ArsR family regulator
VSAAQSRFSVTADSRRLRRQLGPTAWAALEDLALDAALDGGRRLMAGTNARRVAAHLGVSKDAAARALSRLRDAGLVVRHDAGHRADGTFGPVAYELVVGSLEGVALSGDQVAAGRCVCAAEGRSRRREAMGAVQGSPAAQQGLFDIDAVVAR